MYAGENAYTKALFDTDQQLAQATFIRDHWVPEMKGQLSKAANGDLSALKTVARGLASESVAIEGVEFQDGLNPEEVKSISALLDHSKALSREQWKTAKTEKDVALKNAGWDQPAIASQVKSEQFNQVLHDWTTGQDVLTSAVAIEDDRIINIKNSLYASAEWPGSGAFHAAETNVFGTWPKRYGNWMILWLSTLVMMVALVILPKINFPGRPRRT